MTAKRTHTPFIVLGLIVGLLCLAAGAALWRLHEAKKTSELQAMTLLPEPRAIAAFSLTDQQGNPFTRDDLNGHWSLLFFGYTSCPDVCPTTLYQLKLARQQMLQQTPAKNIPRVYFISVDPERDTEKKLAEYLHYFDPNFVGLRGTDEQLKALTMQLGIAYRVAPHETGSTQYEVDHTASLLLLDRRGRLYGILSAPHEAAAMAHDVMSVTR